MIANYGDVVPRRDFEALKVNFEVRLFQNTMSKSSPITETKTSEPEITMSSKTQDLNPNRATG